MGVTNRAIHQLENEIAGKQRAEDLLGIPYTGTDLAKKDNFLLSSAMLASEAYTSQVKRLADQLDAYRSQVGHPSDVEHERYMREKIGVDPRMTGSGRLY